MSERNYQLLLTDIRASCDKILDYTRECSYEDFLHTPMLVDAVVRNLEIIGEARRKLPPGFRKRNPLVEVN